MRNLKEYIDIIFLEEQERFITNNVWIEDDLRFKHGIAHIFKCKTDRREELGWILGQYLREGEYIVIDKHLTGINILGIEDIYEVEVIAKDNKKAYKGRATIMEKNIESLGLMAWVRGKKVKIRRSELLPIPRESGIYQALKQAYKAKRINTVKRYKETWANLDNID